MKTVERQAAQCPPEAQPNGLSRNPASPFLNGICSESEG
jgi:hypothetical protein